MLSEMAENIKGQARGQKEKNRRTGAEEQERDSKERKNKSEKQGTKEQEQKNRNSANTQKNKNRKTRTEEQEQRQGTEKQDHRTGPKNKRGAHKTNAKQTQHQHHPSIKPTTPPKTPTPVLGSRHKQNNRQNNKHRTQTLLLPFQLHSALRASLRWNVNHPPLARGSPLKGGPLASASARLPAPTGAGGLREQEQKQSLYITPSCLPQLVNKKKKKYITKQQDNKTTHELQANLRAHPSYS